MAPCLCKGPLLMADKHHKPPPDTSSLQNSPQFFWPFLASRRPLWPHRKGSSSSGQSSLCSGSSSFLPPSVKPTPVFKLSLFPASFLLAHTCIQSFPSADLVLTTTFPLSPGSGPSPFPSQPNPSEKETCVCYLPSPP